MGRRSWERVRVVCCMESVWDPCSVFCVFVRTLYVSLHDGLLVTPILGEVLGSG